MPHSFDDETITGVLRHMNSDHTDDNVLIARAFGPDADALGATMTGFDGDGGDWTVDAADASRFPLRVAWPGGPITARPEVRREIVALYEAACERLGIEARPHG
jgi:hypothetical protein